MRKRKLVRLDADGKALKKGKAGKVRKDELAAAVRQHKKSAKKTIAA